MSEIFRKSTFGYVGLVLTWIFPILFIIISIPNSSSELFELSNLLGLIGITVLLVSPSLVVTFSVLQQYSIGFSDIGITRNLFGRSTIIYWNEIEDVQHTLFKLTLKTRKKFYNINLVLFKRPDEIVDLVNKRVRVAKANKSTTQ